ncbi:MAG: sensor histidine kinase [Opitutaceae bacterium]|nr:sensor histidine kinase [Opitutaceae bacterium]
MNSHRKPVLSELCLAATEHAPLPMATAAGATHLLRYVNPAFCRMMKRPAKQLLGKPLGKLLPKKDACVRSLDRVFRSGRPESFTGPKRSKSHPISWSYTIWPVVAGREGISTPPVFAGTAERGKPVRADDRLVGVMIQVTETAAFRDRAVEMNEALLLGSVRQHELTETAENLNAQLRAEIDEREQAEAALRAARAQLAAHAEQLEGLVTKRTADLLSSNRQLAVSLALLNKGHEEYRNLFLESEAMQKKLRFLTRQILTTQEEERKQISRELHDEVVQTLVSINVDLTALRADAAASGPKLQNKIARTQRLVEGSVHAVHRFARGLRPAVLDDLGLIAALHAYCKNLAAQKKIIIKLTAFHGAEALGGDERTVLFRVAQEALTNVARHAGATHVRISISKIAAAIRMEIADNGKSFAVEKTLRKENNKRLGLVGMRERVEMVGGSLTIESTPGTGTTVRAEVPFKPAARN